MYNIFDHISKIFRYTHVSEEFCACFLILIFTAVLKIFYNKFK